MTKKVKLAVIKDGQTDKCPFGLPIPFACQHAGQTIEKLASMDIMPDADEKDQQAIADANIRMMSWLMLKGTCDVGRCPYAAKIFKNQNAVECNYYDTAPGEGQKSVLRASPFFSQIYSGVGLNGLLTYPIGYYADYNTSRNLFWSLFSLNQEDRREILKKLASESMNNE